MTTTHVRLIRRAAEGSPFDDATDRDGSQSRAWWAGFIAALEAAGYTWAQIDALVGRGQASALDISERT